MVTNVLYNSVYLEIKSFITVIILSYLPPVFVNYWEELIHMRVSMWDWLEKYFLTAYRAAVIQ